MSSILGHKPSSSVNLRNQRNNLLVHKIQDGTSYRHSSSNRANGKQRSHSIGPPTVHPKLGEETHRTSP